MNNNYPKLPFSFALSLFFVFSSFAQKNLWTSILESEIQAKTVSFYKAKPKQHHLLNLDREGLNSLLTNIPQRQFSNRNQGVIIEFPNQSGKLESFLVQEASVMEYELQNQFPEIRSFVGRGINDPSALLRFSLSPQKGLSAMILSKGRTVFIEPYSEDLESYISFVNSPKDEHSHDFVCETESVQSDFKLSDEEVSALRNANDGTLRTYRLALACTVEYAQFHGGTLPSVLAAMNTTMTRVNGIYERDLGVRMVIVANNANVIFLGPNVNSDPYDNFNGGAMLAQNQATCDSNIGSANYDIGHVFSTGGGGIAGLNSVCTVSGKARGVTGLPAPIGDAFDVDYVCHEFGHQYGANHTQNNPCQRSAVSVEPGSASTIMGYAGICPPNVQTNSDDYFHAVSIEEMWTNISIGSGSSCFTGSPTNNVAPVANAGSNFSIPRSTAFILKGAATDSDTPSGLTYCWEQIDPTPAPMPPQSTSTAGPAFRSLDPTLSPDRYMPPLSTVMSGSLATTWEVVPSVARTMNFSLTVRDNELGGAATDSDVMSVDVQGGTPFTVNTPPTWGPGSSQQATWVVGETDIAPINCQSVNILFTTDNGSSFTTLASGVPNTGTATITVPSISDTNNAKLLVEAADNIFYAVSDAFTVSNAQDFSISSITGDQSICGLDDSATFDFNYIATNGFSETAVFSVTGLPAGVNSNFTPPSLNSSGQFSLGLTNLNAVANGSYTLTITGTSPSLTRSTDVVLTISDSACPQSCETFASAPNLGLPIPDGLAANTPGSPLTDVITIPANEDVTISDILVSVNISHTYIQDLVIELEHPNGSTSTAVWDRECTFQNDIVLTFQMGGPGIDCGQTSSAGVYAPSGDLSVFNGLNSAGDWTLTIRDFFNADIGILNDWSLEVCSVLSVEDYEIENLSIFPNPNNGEFNIGFNPRSGEDITIEIFDLRGRAIFAKRYNAVSRFEEVIKLNNAQSGMYLLNITDGPQKVTKKIIVE